MFTTEQVERMESALLTYRSSLLSSQACTPVTLYNNDAALLRLSEPAQRLCAPSYAPLISIRNKGSESLTALNITVMLNGEVKDVYHWTGNLASWDTASIRLPQYSIGEGDYILSVKLSEPNSKTDEDSTNDLAAAQLLYYKAGVAVEEGFEGTGSIPAGWDIVSSENAPGWSKTDGIASSGSTSMQKATDAYGNGRKALLRMPETYFTNVDSAYLTFKIAAAPVVGVSGHTTTDTLEVLLSQDCGNSYQTLYKKYGSSLVTRAAAATMFLPSASEWRKDTVNLLNYIDKGNALLAFRISNYNQSNIYIDDINVFTVKVNPNLKARGFLITPNPTTGIMNVQFYPAPEKLLTIQVYTLSGQRIRNIIPSNGISSLYTLDLTSHPSGIYMVRALFRDKVIVRKIIKQ